MALAWQCACGASFPETGNASGWGRWRHHLRGRKPGCRRIGLVDEETGEVLVSADQNPLNALREAEQKGYVDPNRPRVRPRAEPSDPAAATEAEGTLAGAGGNGTNRGEGSASGGSPRNLEGVIPYQRIPLHPRIYMQKAITDDWLVREDGRPYGWDSADVAEWVNGMVDLGFAYALRQHLMEQGHSSGQVAALLQNGLLSKLISTAQGMSAQEIRSLLQEQGLTPAAELVGEVEADAEGD